MYSKNPITPFGDLPEELEIDMGQMIDAFNLEVLNLNYVDHLIKVRNKVVDSGKK